MKQAGSILVVDDNPDILIATKLLLKKHFDSITTTDSPFEIENILKTSPVDVILLDMNFTRDSISGSEGFYWLKKVIAQAPETAVVLMTAYGEIQLAVDAIKQGATDFLPKPWKNEELLACITAALGHAKDKKQVSRLKRQAHGLSAELNNSPFEFIANSDVMIGVIETINRVAKTDANVLITGESGTGKEMVAQAIHQNSLRANEAFISLDMGAIAPSLFESELFGHKKGAFTDAKSDRIGRFELASGGSLFLDELANLPIEHQVKMLAALQNRTVTPVGATSSVDVDIRLISATNDNLSNAVTEGRFRQDLLYRINTVEISLPPLRERKTDIPLLVNYYLDYFCRKYERDLKVTPETISKLSEYNWPGNVRELSHMIERAVILSDSSVLDMGLVLPSNSNIEHKENHRLLSDNNCFDLEVVEKQTIRDALKHFQGNVSHAANALGLTRGALYRRLDKYGL